MGTTQCWIISLKAPSDRQMPRKLTGICPSDSVQIGTGENRSRKQCRQFGVEMAPHTTHGKMKMDRKTAVRPYRCTRSFLGAVYERTAYFMFRSQRRMPVPTWLWNGVCHRNKQGKPIGFSARRRGDGGFWGTSPIPLAYACRNQSISITAYHYILKDRRLSRCRSFAV